MRSLTSRPLASLATLSLLGGSLLLAAILLGASPSSGDANVASTDGLHTDERRSFAGEFPEDWPIRLAYENVDGIPLEFVGVSWSDWSIVASREADAVGTNAVDSVVVDRVSPGLVYEPEAGTILEDENNVDSGPRSPSRYLNAGWLEVNGFGSTDTPPDLPPDANDIVGTLSLDPDDVRWHGTLVSTGCEAEDDSCATTPMVALEHVVTGFPLYLALEEKTGWTTLLRVTEFEHPTDARPVPVDDISGLEVRQQR